MDFALIMCFAWRLAYRTKLLAEFVIVEARERNWISYADQVHVALLETRKIHLIIRPRRRFTICN